MSNLFILGNIFELPLKNEQKLDENPNFLALALLPYKITTFCLKSQNRNFVAFKIGQEGSSKIQNGAFADFKIVAFKIVHDVSCK